MQTEWAHPNQDRWSGIDFLANIHGNIQKFPPFRVMFLASRLNATGLLHVVLPGQALRRLGVHKGRIVFWDGWPDCSLDLGAAVAAGQAIEGLLQQVAERLGSHLAQLLTQNEGDVQFVTAWSPPPRAFPLPLSMPRLLAAGLRQARSEADVSKFWSQYAAHKLHVLTPDDSSEDRWGLDATALRLLKLSPRAQNSAVLLDIAAPGEPSRRPELLRSLDLLVALGFLSLSAPQPVATPVATPVAAPVATPVAAPVAQPVAPPTPVAVAEPAVVDPSVERLKKALAGFQGAHPVQVMDLTHKKRLTEEDVANAFRDVSRLFHPDLFAANTEAHALAERCFTLINEANAALTQGGLADANRFLSATASGLPYISEKDHLAARVAFKKGELAFKNRDWPQAEPLLEEAFRLDPITWPHALLRNHARYLCKKVTLNAVLKDLEQIQIIEPRLPPPQSNDSGQRPPPRAPYAAEVQVLAGNLLKLEGRQEEALTRFKKALSLDSECRDAQREVRMQDKRATAAAEENWFDKLLKK